MLALALSHPPANVAVTAYAGRIDGRSRSTRGCLSPAAAAVAWGGSSYPIVLPDGRFGFDLVKVNTDWRVPGNQRHADVVASNVEQTIASPTMRANVDRPRCMRPGTRQLRRSGSLAPARVAFSSTTLECAREARAIVDAAPARPIINGCWRIVCQPTTGRFRSSGAEPIGHYVSRSVANVFPTLEDDLVMSVSLTPHFKDVQDLMRCDYSLDTCV